MSTIHFNPAKNFVDNLFNHSIADFIGSDVIHTHPSTNVVETKENFRVELAAPGLEKNDFSLKVEKNHLLVKGEKADQEAREGEKFTRREFNYTAFERSFRLPKTVDSEGITATYQDGILSVTLPKKEEAKEKPAKAINIS